MPPRWPGAGAGAHTLAMDANAARIMARAECLKAAIAFRTPGTTPGATLLIAEQFWDWLAIPDADTPAPCPAPLTAPKAARPAGAPGKAADRAEPRGNPSVPEA